MYILHEPFTTVSSYLRPARLGQEEGEAMFNSPPPASMIFSPAEGACLWAGSILVEGYAVAAFSREIERVELSLDGGYTWIETKLSEKLQPGEWRMWHKNLELVPNHYQLIVRAVDDFPARRSGTAWHGIHFEVVQQAEIG